MRAAEAAGGLGTQPGRSAGQRDEELLAAPAGDPVHRADGAAQHRGDLAEHRVADEVAVPVVHVLEVVHVHQDEADLLARAQRGAEPLHGPPVRQARQGVLLGEAQQDPGPRLEVAALALDAGARPDLVHEAAHLAAVPLPHQLGEQAGVP